MIAAEVLAVAVEIAQFQLCEAACQPLAHLLVHPPKTGPAHLYLWQGPLEKTDAILVLHGWGSGRGEAGVVAFAAVVHHQLPGVFAGIVAQQVDTSITAAYLEVAVTGIEPAVDHLLNLNLAFTEQKAARLLVGAMAGVALHMNPGLLLIALMHVNNMI